MNRFVFIRLTMFVLFRPFLLLSFLLHSSVLHIVVTEKTPHNGIAAKPENVRVRIDAAVGFLFLAFP